MLHPATEMPVEVVTPDQQLARMVSNSGLAPEKQKGMLEALMPLAVKAAGILSKSRAITVTSADQLTEMANAKENRIGLMRFRTGVEVIRKQANADVTLQKKTIDDLCKWLVSQTETEEERLRACEEFAKRAESARLEKRKSDRTAALKPFADPELFAFDEMDDDRFAALLAKVKLDHQAEAERILRAKADAELADIKRAEDHERQRQENVRLLSERIAAEKELALQRELAEAERREAQEAQRKVEETARKERMKIEEDARAERAEAAKKLREAEDTRLAAEAREKARLAEIKKQEQAAERAKKKAAAAPDAVKLRVFASALVSLPKPMLNSHSGANLAGAILRIVGDAADEIGKLAETLES